MKIIILIKLLLISTCLFGQTIMQSVNTSSSLLMGDKKHEFQIDKQQFEFNFPHLVNIIISTNDKKLSVENLYHFQLKNSRNFFVLGMGSSSKINNSISSIFENKNVVGGVTGSLLFGFSFFRICNEDKIYEMFVDGINNNVDNDILKNQINNTGGISGHWIYINPSIEGRKFDLFSPTSAFNSQIRKKVESLWSLNIGYNYWSPSFFGMNTIFGVSFTPKFTDNFSDLKEISLLEQQSITNDTIQRTWSSKTTVYQGEYKTSLKKDLNFEMFLVPKKMPTFGLYLGHLTTFEKDVKSKTAFSFGLFFSKQKSPTNPSLGIVANFKDIYGNSPLDSENKFSVNLVTKLNIGSIFK